MTLRFVWPIALTGNVYAWRKDIPNHVLTDTEALSPCLLNSYARIWRLIAECGASHVIRRGVDT